MTRVDSHAFLSPVIGSRLVFTARHGQIWDFASQEIEVGKDLAAITRTS